MVDKIVLFSKCTPEKCGWKHSSEVEVKPVFRKKEEA